MKELHVTALVVASLLTAAGYAAADEPQSKTSAVGEAPGSKATAAKAAEKSERGRSHADPGAKPPQAKVKAAGTQKEERGRPGGSDAVAGKAKGLDKEPRGRALGHDKQRNETDDNVLEGEVKEKSREVRKLERVVELKRQWGEALLLPSVQAELKKHARRVARLTRVKELAEANGDTKRWEQVDKLLSKEDEHHAKRMARLSGENGSERGPGIKPAALDKDRKMPDRSGRVGQDNPSTNAARRHNKEDEK